MNYYGAKDLADSFRTVRKNTITIAQEIPEEKYNFRPAPEWTASVQDLSGRSVFYQNAAGEVFHTYSSYGRGGEQVLGIYGILDAMPKGRNETGPYHSLTDWARPRNMYGKGGEVEHNGRYHAPSCGCAKHSK